ncbi:MAG: tetratricopeptide (TPR) repeat protein [Saprospiraceae bacterium]|jgi:tetratricopeptide (TPR) repeat protein
MENWRLNHLEELLKEDPKDEFVHYALAQEYIKQENYEEAIKRFDILKSLNPDYLGLYYHLAAAQIEADLPEDAMTTYETGITIAKKIGDQHALSELLNAKTNLDLGL